MTTIVNKKSGQPYDIYAGRPSIFGNPYVIGPDGTRDQVIRKFKIDFDFRIENDEDFRNAILKLKDKRIACWCDFPREDCHLRIIKEFLDNYEG